ncbi:hypothetical protein [Cyprinid herpesvirus 2]|nr:hypothetical protein [Cyprinid herpesvirus 2]
MWGTSAIHLNDMTIDDLMYALDWPDVVSDEDAEWREQSEEALQRDERKESELVKTLNGIMSGDLLHQQEEVKRAKAIKKGTMDAYVSPPKQADDQQKLPGLVETETTVENKIAYDRRVPRFHPMALKHALSIAAVTEVANYGVHLLFDMFVPKTGKVPVGWPLRAKLERGLAFIRDTHTRMKELQQQGHSVFNTLYSTPVRKGLLDDAEFQESFVKPVDLNENNIIKILVSLSHNGRVDYYYYYISFRPPLI